MTDTLHISEIAYELYKQDWVDSYVSKESRLYTLREYLMYRKDCLENDDDVDSFDEWLWWCGYHNGGLYACYEEFLDEEYLEEDYMCGLLENKKLIAMYFEDIKE